MCEQCFTESEFWGEIISGWHLVRATKDGVTMKSGDWGLAECNDPVFIFSTTPIKYPSDSLTNKEVLVFESICSEIEEQMGNSIGKGKLRSWGKLYEAIQENGYTTDDGSPMMWLCNYIANYIEDHESFR